MSEKGLFADRLKKKLMDHTLDPMIYINRVFQLIQNVEDEMAVEEPKTKGYLFIGGVFHGQVIETSGNREWIAIKPIKVPFRGNE